MRDRDKYHGWQGLDWSHGKPLSPPIDVKCDCGRTMARLLWDTPAVPDTVTLSCGHHDYRVKGIWLSQAVVEAMAGGYSEVTMPRRLLATPMQQDLRIATDPLVMGARPADS